jgi:hypothetical protein
LPIFTSPIPSNLLRRTSQSISRCRNRHILEV